MRKKDILELKRRLKKDHVTFTKMCGCYVNGEKHTILKFRETFLNLEEEEYFKYLELAKKLLSGTIGNNLLPLEFPLDEELKNNGQLNLLKLKNSKLKDDELLDEFYENIISTYNYTGNYLILIFHDCYDVITKTKDNIKVDESEEVFEYLLCGICPVSLTQPGLKYFEGDNIIASRDRDWVVESPINGFMYPTFSERSTDVNTLTYYTKNPKDTHIEFMEDVLGCSSKQTTSIKKENFKILIEDTINEEVYMDVQDGLNTIIEEYNAMYEDTEPDPIPLTKKEVSDLLLDNKIEQEVISKIEKTFDETFDGETILVEELLDNKILKVNEQRKKEEHLQKQVQTLKTRLDEVLEEQQEFDVIVKVTEEKVNSIKSEIIDGQKYIMIPVNDNEEYNFITK